MDTFYASFEKNPTHFFAIYQFKFNANMTDSTAYSCNGVIFTYDEKLSTWRNKTVFSFNRKR